MHRAVAIITAMVFASGTAVAQTDQSCIAFEDALAISVDVNPQIEGAEAERDLARANLLATLSQDRPQVVLFAQTGEGDGRLQNNQRDNQVGIQLQQTLYNFGANRMARASAQEQVQAAEYSIAETQVRVAQETGTAYLEALRSAAIQVLTEEQEQYNLQDALTADERLRAQAITIADASQVKASAAIATSQRIDATLVRDQALTRLALLLDFDSACTSGLSAFIYADDTEEVIERETLDSILDVAARNAASLKRAQSQIRSARATTEQNRRAGLPVISFQAFAAYEEDIDINGPTGEFITRDRIGLNVTSQLYSGGLGKARVDDSLARLRSANSELTSARIALEDNVTRAWVRIKAQQQTLEALADARINYRTQLDSIQSEYRIGTRPLGDVVQAAERYYSTASQEINTRYQYYNNLFTLRTTVFGLDE